MQRKRTTISQGEYARLRGLNRSTISRQVQNGAIPTHDGRIDPVEADRARGMNLDQAKRAVAVLRKQNLPPDRDSDPGVQGAGVDDAIHQARVGALADIAAKSEILKFARCALHLGCTPEVAGALGQLHGLQAGAALTDIECDDLDGARFVDPEPGEWRAVLGTFDLDEADRLCNSVAMVLVSGPEKREKERK